MVPKRDQIFFQGYSPPPAKILPRNHPITEALCQVDQVQPRVPSGRALPSGPDATYDAALDIVLEIPWYHPGPAGPGRVWLDAELGFNGAMLSGGAAGGQPQRQSVCVAHAVVKDPAALCESERVVNARTRAQGGSGRPRRAAAHRLASICNADRIFVLANVGGELMERVGGLDCTGRFTAGRGVTLVPFAVFSVESGRAHCGERRGHATPATLKMSELPVTRTTPFLDASPRSCRRFSASLTMALASTETGSCGGW